MSRACDTYDAYEQYIATIVSPEPSFGSRYSFFAFEDDQIYPALYCRQFVDFLASHGEATSYSEYSLGYGHSSHLRNDSSALSDALKSYFRDLEI